MVSTTGIDYKGYQICDKVTSLEGWRASYKARCLLLGLQSLATRRKIAQCLFVACQLNNTIDAPNILSTAPKRSLKPCQPFHISRYRTNFEQNEPIKVMCVALNHVYDLYEFNMSYSAFRERLRLLYRTLDYN